MDQRYILFISAELSDSGHVTPEMEATLFAAGMTCQMRTASTSLFISSRTPTLSIPGQGLIIGRIFQKNGAPVEGTLGFAGTADELTDYLLRNTWGEYLAVHASTDGSLTLLRDPTGAIRCVHVLRDSAGFVTSDIALASALGIYHREVDWQAVAHGLSFPYLRTERTALKGVCELLPGSAMTYRGGKVSIRSAWSPWNFVSSDIRHVDPVAAADEVRMTISCVVAALSARDSRFIVELSGGLDSSIVATCLRGQVSRATVCTLVMPVAGTDERPYAQLVADSLDCELVPVEVSMEHARFDFPLPSWSVAPAMGIMQHAVNEAWIKAGMQHGADDFFSGGGGDTVFCYLKTAAPATDAFKERGLMSCMTAIHNLSVLHQCTVWKAGRLTLRKLRRDPITRWRLDDSFLDQASIPEASEHHPWLDAPLNALPGDREKIGDLIGTQLFRDTAPRNENHTMHFPLLSQPVLESCLKVPTWMWIAGGRNRAVARDAFSDHLPRGILDRRSKGSYTGYMAAVYARNKASMREFLEEGDLYTHGLLDRSALAGFFSRELPPRDLSFLRIFDLCTAENWVRHQAQFPD